MPGIDVVNVLILTTTSLLAIDVLPRHLLIVGGSDIGLEFRSGVPAVRQCRHGHRDEASSRSREDEDISAAGQPILEDILTVLGDLR